MTSERTVFTPHFSDTLPGMDAEAYARRLALVNESLAGFTNARFKRLPEVPPGSESLRGKSVAFVDDAAILLQQLMPHIVSATDTKVTAVVYTDQSPDILAQTLIEKHPDIILMDYNLGRPDDDLHGSDMVRALRVAGYTGIIIGFSSESEYNRAFTESGVDGTATKDIHRAGETLRQVAEVVARRSTVK